LTPAPGSPKRQVERGLERLRAASPVARTMRHSPVDSRCPAATDPGGTADPGRAWMDRAESRCVMRALVPEGGMTSFRKEMDRFLERFWDVDEAPMAGAWNPRIDLSETQEALTLKAEMPGIEPKDLQLTIENGIITLQGEKRQEIEDKNERYYRSERNYGS